MATRKHPKTRTNKTAAKKAASKKIAPKKENGKKPNADRSASTANSWTSPKTRAARSKHHGVRVGSTDYRSVKHAFEELKLPLGRHIAFRGKLKKEGALTFEFGDKKFNFKLIAD